MKKSNFIALILGTIGVVFFALGMCMALLPEWGMFNQGVVCGVIGLVLLFILLVNSIRQSPLIFIRLRPITLKNGLTGE